MLFETQAKENNKKYRNSVQFVFGKTEPQKHNIRASASEQKTCSQQSGPVDC